MAAKVILFIARGSEEMEAVICIDMLRRAGIETIVAGESPEILCSRKVKLLPDLLIEELDPDEGFDGIVLPGGIEGTERLGKNSKVSDFLKKAVENRKMIAAICAAPTILKQNRIVEESVQITSHPSVRDELTGYNYCEDKVVVHDNFITSKGAGTAFEFSLKIIEFLIDKKTAEKVAKDIVLI